MITHLPHETLSQLVLGMPDFDGHEEVVFAEDPTSGLRAVIAVHNTFRGPGVGGTRLWRYRDERSALTDVLRLSRGMTYKNAISELPFGGGKAVILAPDFSRVRRPALMQAFGRMVSRLQGRYHTAEDVGTSCEDMENIRRGTDFIFGLHSTSGDPSPHTARGVFLGIQASVEERLRSSSLNGIRVMVQGVGNVGFHLCRLLHRQGAALLVSDLNRDALARCEQEFEATVVSPEKCLEAEAEVYAPCALGATVGPESLDRLKVSIIAGAANNQLVDEPTAEWVHQKGILYAPDYVINAGGIVNIACETGGAYCPTKAGTEVARIKPRLREIFARSRAGGVSPLTVANQIARERFGASPSPTGRISVLSPDRPAPSPIA